MDNDEQNLKKFLEVQLEWSKEQVQVLDLIDEKLQEMKRIAEYALKHELTPREVNELNMQLNEFKNEVLFLEKQLLGVVH